jgi:heme o synthase
MTGAQTAAIPQRPALPSLLRDLVTLTKPKVQSLLLFTTATTMYVAGDPSVGLVFLTCLGGALSAGGVGAIFGALLELCSISLLALAVNPLAAALSFCGFAGYVFVYTLWLKRATPQNIVIGGAAGAVPPLVAWAAVTGGLSGTAFYLFAIVFFWTPPHFWALSLLMKDEYANAGVPMLPVLRGEDETRRQILLYTVLLYAVTQLPFCAGGFGLEYLIASMSLGAGFIYCAVRLLRSADRTWALRTYLFSLAYLALLFLSMPMDARLG